MPLFWKQKPYEKIVNGNVKKFLGSDVCFVPSNGKLQRFYSILKFLNIHLPEILLTSNFKSTFLCLPHNTEGTDAVILIAVVVVSKVTKGGVIMSKKL